MANGKVPWWLLLWNAALSVVLIVLVFVVVALRTFAKDTAAWNKEMRRWAAHYYWCDSIHKNDAQCAAFSDHIPPPPPPPAY